MYPATARLTERLANRVLRPEILITLGGSEPMNPSFFFSTTGVDYPWGAANNSSVFWEPLVSGVGNVRQSIPHLPSEQPQGNGLRRTVQFELENATDSEGVPLIERIQSTINIEFAIVTISELPINPNDPDEVRGDLSGLNTKPGGTNDAEHILRFIGRVRQYSMPSQEIIRFDCVTEVPDTYNFPLFLSEADPRHYGQRAPVVFGANVEKIPGLNARVPDVLRGLPSEYAVLLEPFDDTATGNVAMEIPDLDSWPASGSLRIGKEQLGYSAIAEITDTASPFFGRVDTYNVTISARAETTPTQGTNGNNPTVAAEHFGQDLVSRRTNIDAIDGREVVVAFSQGLFWGLNALYVTDASDGFPKEVTGVELATTTVNDVNYESIGWSAVVAQFDLDQLGIMLRNLARDAEVTQQPTFETAPGSGTITSDMVFMSNQSQTRDDAASDGLWVGIPAAQPLWRYDDTDPPRVLQTRATQTDFLNAKNSAFTDQEVLDATLIEYRFTFEIEAQETNRIEDLRRLTATCIPRNFPPHSNQTFEIELEDDDFPALDTWVGRRLRIGWSMALPEGSTVQDLIDLASRFDIRWKRNSRGFSTESQPEGRLESGRWGLQYRYAVAATIEDPATPVEIFARGDSIDFRFFADADGFPTGAFDGPERNPSIILQRIIEQNVERGVQSLTVSDPSFADMQTQLGAISPDIVTTEYGTTLETQLSGIGFQFRTQVVTVEREPEVAGDWGVRYRLLGPNAPLLPAGADYRFGDPVVTIDEYDEIGFESRDADSIYTGFRAMYRPNRAIRVGDSGYSELFEFVRIGGQDRSSFTNDPVDLATIIGQYGNWQSPMFEFPGIGEKYDSADESMAEVFGYYVQELARNGVVYITRRVPWTQAALLELGDIASLDVPWISGLQKVRVIEIDRNFRDGFVNLRLVEVT